MGTGTRLDPHDIAARLGGAAGTALLCDIDGTLAPIAADAQRAAVPDSTMALLREALGVCAVLALVTGRDMADAERVAPLDRAWMAACHGMHMRSPDGQYDVDPVAAGAREQLQLVATLAQTVGWRYEDKGHAVTIHFRHVDTPELTAQQMRAQIATIIDPRVVAMHDARRALEVRPVGGRTKRDAVATVLENIADRARAVVYIGDDTTDIDAFAALDDCGLRAVRVAVDSDEAPAGLLARADIVLEGQHAVDGLLAAVLRA